MFNKHCLWLIFVFLGMSINQINAVTIPVLNGRLSYSEKWGYINVRPKAHMFWWLYYINSGDSATSNRPLVMWLQGGPGASGCGYGNFQELGPLDVRLRPRNFTWLQKADLLFVDNPVGAGFSYVTDDTAYTKNIDEIAADLLAAAKQWFSSHPQYRLRPFYIMSESYGGKMAAAFANVLYPAMISGHVKCSFAGVVLGDSWISPMDFVNLWGPYLYYLSYMSDSDLETYSLNPTLHKFGLREYKSFASKCQRYVEQQLWVNATQCWDGAERLVGRLTDDVSWYNVLKRENSDPWSFIRTQYLKISPIERLFQRHVQRFYDADQLSQLMNGPIRNKLKVIPANVTWGGQSGYVFNEQEDDFMKPVINIVDNLLTNNTIKVVIYEGQLDLICCTVGTELWMKKLTWPELSIYRNQHRIPFRAGPAENFAETAGFYKKYKNFLFFWLMRAGHMVPVDSPYAALKMLDLIFLNDNDSSYGLKKNFY